MNDNNINKTHKPGDKISRYEVVSVLGVGGQAIVYKCHDPGLDRFVAVKQVAANLAHNKAYLDQLRKTVLTIAKLGQKDAAIIDIYELIEDETGFYYAMEFVEGHTLEFLLQEAQGPIEVKATLMILFRMASALYEIHQAGIIHRDIKPNNIILTAGLHPKIIDFGVASLPDSDFSMPLVTTKYLAPELYEGGSPTGAADIYSLGFMAYEMLAGREKFNEIFEDILKDKSTATLRWMKWHGNQSVSAPPLNTINPQVPLTLSNIIMRMIEKDLTKRITDTEELGLLIKQSFSPKAKNSAPPAQAAPARPAPLSGRPAGLPPVMQSKSNPAINPHQRPLGTNQPTGAGNPNNLGNTSQPIGFIPEGQVAGLQQPVNAPKSLSSDQSLDSLMGSEISSAELPQSPSSGFTPSDSLSGLGSPQPAPSLSDSFNFQPASGEATAVGMLPDQGLATAPIPKEPLSLKAKIIAGASILLVLIAMLSIFIIRSTKDQEEQNKIKHRVTQIYKQAISDFELSKFKECQDGFAKLASDKILRKYYTNRTIGNIYVYLATARINISQGDYISADKNCTAAEELINKTINNTKGKAKKLRATLARLKETCDETLSLTNKSSRFASKAAKIKSLLDAAKNNDDFTEIRSLISKTKADTTLNLTKLQIKKLDRFETQLTSKSTEFTLKSRLAIAKNLVDQEQDLLAIQQYNEILDFLNPTINPNIKRIKIQLQNSAKSKATSEIKRLKLKSDRLAIMSTIEAATTNDEKIEAFQAAINSDIIPNDLKDEFRKKIEELKFEDYLIDAQTKTAEGRKQEAIAAWKKVLEVQPDHEEARQVLAKYAKDAKFESVFNEAETLYHSGKYAKALKIYEKALAMDPSAEIGSKIQSCKYNIILAKAKTKSKAGEYKAAIDLYKSALEIHDEDADDIEQQIEILTSILAYNNAIAQANKALSEQEFEAALKHFKSAQAIDDTEVARNGIRFAKYSIAFKKAKRYADTQPVEASILAKKAQKILDTKEVRDFIKKMQEKFNK